MKMIEFTLLRHGDKLMLPRVGYVRTPCKFVVDISETDSIKTALRAYGYNETDYLCRVVDEEAKKRSLSVGLFSPETNDIMLSQNIDGSK